MDWINSHHLYYFYVVSREGSIANASRLLHLTQPRISVQIRALEEHPGEKLFLRSGRSLVLMEVGHVVFSYAGILTRAEMLAALARHAEDAPVEKIMHREFQAAEAGDMLETVLARLQECNCHTLPVMQHGRLVGLVTADNLGEFLMVQAALSRKSFAAPVGPLQRRAA